MTVTVQENTSYNRSGNVVFDIVYGTATLAVEQAGNGSPEDYIIYYNDFDKEVATQSFGSSGTSWPYLDQFDGWKNETDVGVAGSSYDFSNVSARNNSNSNGSYSDYAGSGSNNLLFGANGHIAVKNLSLNGFTDFKLSFGTEKYDNNDKTALFDPAEMPVYVSADGVKWVPLSYTYKGTAAGRWNIAETVFSVPEGTGKLSVYVMATVASAYRLDDLRIDVSEEAGTMLDFSNGTDLPSGGGDNPGGGGDTPSGELGSGTLADPYTPAGAADAVKNLTWTSNTVYDKTGDVYVKGKISRIASNGTFTESGTFGNASFWISADGSQNGEFQAYRILYFDGKQYTSGTDIKVNDEVIIYGKLMNYRGNTPETVANEAWLYSLNGETGSGGTPGGDTPGGDTGEIGLPVLNPASFTEGNYVIAYTTGGKTYVMKNAIKATYYVDATEFALSKTNIPTAEYIFTVAKSGSGYTIKNNEGSYVGVEVSGTHYNLRPALASPYVWSFTAGEGGAIVAKGDNTGDYCLSYNASYTEFTMFNQPTSCPTFYKVDGSGGGGGTPSGELGSGTLEDPYTPAGANDAVKDLTWTSNSVYDKTDSVYVKGKISRIADKGTYTESGDYGNASFYISADGSQSGEFYAYHINYFGGLKYVTGTDIKVGDVVVIHGPLMNYKNNTPETVGGKAYLYSLNGSTDGSGGGGGDTPGGDTPGGDTPSGDVITWVVGSGNQTWTAATSSDYGAGFSATDGTMTVGYYKSSSTTAPVAPSSDHIRVYKNSHLSIGVAGKRIAGVELTCKPPSGTTSYCFDLAVADGSTAKADRDALKVTWTGDAATFEANAPNGQVRITHIKVTYK